MCPGRVANRTGFEFNLLGRLCGREVQVRQSPSSEGDIHPELQGGASQAQETACFHSAPAPLCVCLVPDTHIFLLHAPRLSGQSPGLQPREKIWLGKRGYTIGEDPEAPQERGVLGLNRPFNIYFQAIFKQGSYFAFSTIFCLFCLVSFFIDAKHTLNLWATASVHRSEHLTLAGTWKKWKS